MTLSIAVLTLVSSVPTTTMSPEAVARYQQATQEIQARAYGPAIERLNALAAEYPRVAEIFASRCSALIANGRFEHAEADCKYALSLKPLQPEALYALAIAEDRQNKRAAASEHYRKYATLDGVPYADQALARANALSNPAAAAAPLVAAQPAGSKLVIYRNHAFAGSGSVMLILDGRVLGDVEYGQYVEIDAAPGSHALEARTRPTNVFTAPRVWTHPVQLGNGTLFMNFDTSGGQIIFQEVPGMQARSEIRDDCKKGWALQGPFDNLPLAGPVQVPQAPAVVVVPGAGPQPYAVPYGGNGGNYCNSTIDCQGGGFCKDRGDGVKVCMDNGVHGDFCRSTIDCGGGLFCKDRGDGMHVCM